MHQFIRRSAVFGIVAALSLAAVAAMEPTVSITGSAPKSVKHGSKLIATIKFAVPSGFHIYAPAFKGVGVKTTFDLQGNPAGFKVLAAQAPGTGELKGSVVMRVPIAVAATVKGKHALTLVVHYQQCNDRICLPPAEAAVSLNTFVK